MGMVKLMDLTDKYAVTTYQAPTDIAPKLINGEVDIDGAPHAWSAVLSYDYSMANASDNLADTVRTIFIYVNS